MTFNDTIRPTSLTDHLLAADSETYYDLDQEVEATELYASPPSRVWVRSGRKRSRKGSLAVAR